MDRLQQVIGMSTVKCAFYVNILLLNTQRHVIHMLLEAYLDGEKEREKNMANYLQQPIQHTKLNVCAQTIPF